MKKTLFVTVFILTCFFVSAQTLAQAEKEIYYNRLETAKSALQLIIAQENAPPDAWYWLGEIYLKQGKIKEANVILSEAIKTFTAKDLSKKNNPLIFIGMAHALMDSGLTGIAKNQIDEVLKEGKYKDPVALIAAAKANIDSKNGDLAQALEFLKLAEKKDKKNPELYLEFGEAYRKMIDGANAIANYDKALALDPSFAEPMYRKGLIYKTQNNVDIYVDRFTKAYAIDSGYAPAIYELYYYYYFRDVAKADTLLKAYIRHADADPQNAYMITDLQYASRKYREAIESSKNIISAEGNKAAPRLYKLIAYSYAALQDSSAALENMNIYFEKQDPLAVVAKDYEFKANLLEKLNPDKSQAITWYRKALAADTNKKETLNYMVTLADLQKELGNREREAVWRESIYKTKEHPSNLDIYNWGLALYGAENYEKADSVFAIYEDKYPEQIYGYLWRARSNALMDTTMEKGLAIPHYLKLAEIAAADSVKNRAILLRAYQYLGAYEATITKNYAASLNYYQKVLSLDPADAEAEKNAKILSKWITEGKGTN
jgi:tetratricopeptide (TPR) repeat protein